MVWIPTGAATSAGWRFEAIGDGHPVALTAAGTGNEFTGDHPRWPPGGVGDVGPNDLGDDAGDDHDTARSSPSAGLALRGTEGNHGSAGDERWRSSITRAATSLPWRCPRVHRGDATTARRSPQLAEPGATTGL